ncbi:MAG TPA: glycine cleavage system aminomethyltransferase GcvT [Thermoplasmata archaeon]|nr:glycine cleavage system aminomethyltransferase GcvT [Thermoplasmata archaeon]
MTEPPSALLRTPLYPFHAGRGAHLVPFAGWEMPLYYDGILPEHAAVRDSAGLFDVGHMGILTVTGAGAVPLLERRTTARVGQIAPGQVRYTFLLDAEGAIIDDLLVTRVDDGTGPIPQFLVVPNAATAAFVFDLLREHRLPNTVLERHNGAATILAVQGPASRSILESLFGWSLGGIGFYHARWLPKTPGSAPSPGRLGPGFPEGLSTQWFVSRTGYTGELGYEIFVPAADALPLAERLVAQGVRPAGLGARDTLRLEKGYLLSGQDFHRDRTPLEAAQDRFVEFDHDFVGRPVLDKQRREGVPARLAGLRVDQPGAIPRHGTPVLQQGAPVAVLTSGGLSPTLGYGIALAYLPPALGVPGTRLELQLRGRTVPAEVVPLPFLAPRPRPPAGGDRPAGARVPP